MQQPLPRVIAHRGASAEAPENTLAAFRRAAELGARCVELDVRLARDGVPVVIHDSRLRHTTAGSGRVADRTAAELAGLDAGSWFAPAFSAERVPSLADALALIASLGLGALVEIKPAPGAEDAVAAATAAAIRAHWRGAGGPPVVSSFSRTVLAAMARVAADLPRALNLDALPRDWEALARGLGCAHVVCNHGMLDEARVRAIRAAGFGVAAYTVDEPGRARALVGMGLDAVISNDPRRLLPALG